MRLYAGMSREFVDHAVHNRIAALLRDAFQSVYRYRPSPSEEHSWRNSLRAVSQVFEHGHLLDHGVKHHMRELLLSSPEAFESYLKAVQSVKPVPYDIKADPAGEFRWRILREHIARDHPINTPFKNKAKTLEEVLVVVRRILAQFQHLIEQRGL